MNEDEITPTDMTTVPDSIDLGDGVLSLVGTGHWVVGVDYCTVTFPGEGPREAFLAEVTYDLHPLVSTLVDIGLIGLTAAQARESIEGLMQAWNSRSLITPEPDREATSPDSFTMRFTDLTAEAEAEMEAWQGVLRSRRTTRNDSGGGSVQRKEEGSTPDGA